jgi:ankyrin repeat protein
MSYAALEGNVQVMRYLLDRGGDPAMPDERGSTALHHAALRGALSLLGFRLHTNSVSCSGMIYMDLYYLYGASRTL